MTPHSVVVPSSAGATVQPLPGLTLEQYALAKQLSVPRLRSWGLSDTTIYHRPALAIPYRGVDGRDGPVRLRHAIDKGPQGDERFTWRKGSTPCLYGLDRLADARATHTVVLCEGESDCHTLWHHDVPALGLPGAGGWKAAWASHLEGIATVHVVIEDDSGGAAVLAWLATAGFRDRVRLVTLVGHKDPSALYLDDPDGFVGHWAEAIAAAEPWTDYAARQQQAQVDAEWPHCAALAQRPDILAELDASLERRGLVGEQRASRLTFLAIVSRLLRRPVSIVIKGPSSGGKSFLVQEVLAHCPPEAYHALSAMSERALVYSEEPLAHRMLVLYEAAGMAGDFASYVVRSLLSEGYVKYETVEKGPDGMRPRLIVRDGPTGLITTTTAVSLHPENETRLLSIPVSDTQSQTRHILRSLAQDRRPPTSDDLQPWHSLQLWLAGTARPVVVPYATRLADLVPPIAVRLRRDFTQLLRLIEAHALLHQVTRDRDAEGRIIATLADYAAVRTLVHDLIEAGVQATVPQTLRDTVAAVTALCVGEASVSGRAIATRLQLDKSVVSRRIKVALAEGYLVNRATGKGQPQALVLGDPLPEDRMLLPEPASLAETGCSVADDTEGMDWGDPFNT